ncbi:MAG: DNA translocase FtsK 4TM domain-containing protein, partial [Pseudomonadota bacterium]
MATRAVTTRPGNSRKSTAEWRAGLRRSIRRATHMTGAGLLLLALFFLALAFASYTHTDPSLSTSASGDQIGNWMGRAGAWAADAIFLAFGLPALLFLPLL